MLIFRQAPIIRCFVSTAKRLTSLLLRETLKSVRTCTPFPHMLYKHHGAVSGILPKALPMASGGEQESYTLSVRLLINTSLARGTTALRLVVVSLVLIAIF